MKRGFSGSAASSHMLHCAECPISDGVFGGGISAGVQSSDASWTMSLSEFREASAHLAAGIRSGGGGISSCDIIPPHLAEELRLEK